MYMPEFVMFSFRSSRFYREYESDSKNARRFIEFVVSLDGESVADSLSWGEEEEV